jgi:hypothetical protein
MSHRHMQRTFPILASAETRAQYPRAPYEIQWDLLERHERQILKTYGRSIEGVAQSGGMTWCEVVAVMEERAWRPMEADEAISRMEELIRAEEFGVPSHLVAAIDQAMGIIQENERVSTESARTRGAGDLLREFHSIVDASRSGYGDPEI